MGHKKFAHSSHTLESRRQGDGRVTRKNKKLKCGASPSKETLSTDGPDLELCEVS